MMVDLIRINKMRNSTVGAFTFGVELSEGQVCFPSAPTWALYSHEGAKSYCFEDVPMLVEKGTFCDVYTLQTGKFRTYRSWMLSALLSQSDMQTVSYPLVAFRSANFSEDYGVQTCSPMKLHAERAAQYVDTAVSMFGDAQDYIHLHEFFRMGKPIASLKLDFPSLQGHMGWSFGYITKPFIGEDSQSPPVLEPLHWLPERGVWGCENPKHKYPIVSLGQFHPCVSGKGTCCGGSKHAAVAVRFTFYTTHERARILFNYELKPKCGDGVNLYIILYRAEAGQPPKILTNHKIDVVTEGVPQIKPVTTWRESIHAGDIMDVVVEPGTSMACDGFSWRLWKIWPE